MSPQIQFFNINAGYANGVVAEMVYLCTTFVVDPICRDLRAFGGTSLDHKFLVWGPKSIYTTGEGGLVKEPTFSGFFLIPSLNYMSGY